MGALTVAPAQVDLERVVPGRYEFTVENAGPVVVRVAEKFVSSGQFSGYLTDWRTGIMLAFCPFGAYLVAGAFNYYGRRPFESPAARE